MALIVQKYGGSSVGSIDRIRNVARRLVETQQAGNRVVAVVSAMSGVTDRLIGMAREVTENPPTRELDMLMATGEQQSIALLGMAITEMGYKARSFTGRQAGIFTYGSHTRARIRNIDPQPSPPHWMTATSASARASRALPQTEPSARSAAADPTCRP